MATLHLEAMEDSPMSPQLSAAEVLSQIKFLTNQIDSLRETYSALVGSTAAGLSAPQTDDITNLTEMKEYPPLKRPPTDSNFKQPRRTRKRPKTQTTHPTETNNTYEIFPNLPVTDNELTNPNDDATDKEERPTQQTQNRQIQPKPHHIAPVIIRDRAK